MKVLLCHNHYQQRGGEDESFAAEGRLLEARGHPVVYYTLHNDAIAGMSRREVAVRTVWNRQVYRELRGLIRRERPAVMHCTNTFPLISPAAYYAARAEGVPVLQALRNYRLLCPGALLLRDGKVCEDCLGKVVPWPAVLHGCYRDSRAGTAVVAAMLAAHRLAGTWDRAIDLYFTLTEFARGKFLEAGFPAERVAVKPNFLDEDPGVGSGAGGHAVFVGRLSPEKGVATLLEAWRLAPDLPALTIVGDGPLAGDVQSAARADPRLRWLGRLPLPEIFPVIRHAACLLMPSVWYETFGRTIIEAYACGTPVVASNLGAMAELVGDGRTGVLFEPNNPTDLAARLRGLLAGPGRLAAMRQAARHEFETKYSANIHYTYLLALYERLLRGRGGTEPAAGGPRQPATQNGPVPCV